MRLVPGFPSARVANCVRAAAIYRGAIPCPPVSDCLILAKYPAWHSHVHSLSHTPSIRGIPAVEPRKALFESRRHSGRPTQPIGLRLIHDDRTTYLCCRGFP
jgi:hypothetical protein